MAILGILDHGISNDRIGAPAVCCARVAVASLDPQMYQPSDEKRGAGLEM